MKIDIKNMSKKKKGALLLVPLAAGAAALAVYSHVAQGKKKAKPRLAEYFGPLDEYDRVTIYKNGAGVTYCAGQPAYGTMLRLLDDLSLDGARQRFGNDEDVADGVRFVLALEHRTSRAAVVFTGPNQIRLTPPSGRWVVLDGDFEMSYRALSALIDEYGVK